MNIVFISKLFIEYSRKKEQTLIIDILEKRIKEIKPDIVFIGGYIIKDKTNHRDVKLTNKLLKFLSEYHIIHYLTTYNDIDFSDFPHYKIIDLQKFTLDKEYNLHFIDHNLYLNDIQFPQLIQSSPNDIGPFGFRINYTFEQITNDYGFVKLIIKNNTILNKSFPRHPKWTVELINSPDYNLAEIIGRWGLPMVKISIADPIKKSYESYITNQELHKSYTKSAEPKQIIDLHFIHCENVLCFSRININFKKLYNCVSGIISANEMGKSSFIRILMASLSDTIDSSFLRRGTSVGYIKLITSTKTITYTIFSSVITKSISSTISYDTLVYTSFILSDNNNIDKRYINTSLKTVSDKILDKDIKYISSTNVYKDADIATLNKVLNSAKLQKLLLYDEIKDYDEQLKNHKKVKEKIVELEKLIFSIDSTTPSQIENEYVPNNDYFEIKPKHSFQIALENKIFVKNYKKNENIEKITEEISRKKKYLELFTCENIDEKIHKNRQIIKEHTNTAEYERENAFLIVSRITSISQLLQNDVDRLEKELEVTIENDKKFEKYKNATKDLKHYKEKFIREYLILIKEYKNFEYLSKLEEKFNEIKTNVANIENQIISAEKYKIINKQLKELKQYRSEINLANKDLLEIQTDKVLVCMNNIFPGISLKGDDIYFNGHIFQHNSSYRRFSINFAFRLAMWQLTQESVVSGLFIDENLGSCDEEHIKTIMDMIETISYSDYMPRIIFIISHIEYVKTRINYNLVIQKTPTGNVLEN